MRQQHQIVMEYLNSGMKMPADTAMRLIDEGFDLSLIEDQIDGYEIIDPTDVDYFEYIDNNH